MSTKPNWTNVNQSVVKQSLTAGITPQTDMWVEHSNPDNTPPIELFETWVAYCRTLERRLNAFQATNQPTIKKSLTVAERVKGGAE